MNVTHLARSRPAFLPASAKSGIAVRGHEANELQHHDQRAGRCFRHAEAVEHFAGLKPSVILDRLLRDIGKNGIGGANVPIAILLKKIAIWV